MLSLSTTGPIIMECIQPTSQLNIISKENSILKVTRKNCPPSHNGAKSDGILETHSSPKMYGRISNCLLRIRKKLWEMLAYSLKEPNGERMRTLPHTRLSDILACPRKLSNNSKDWKNQFSSQMMTEPNALMFNL